MSDTTDAWWQSVSGESLSQDDRVARLQHFFAENGEALYPRVGEKNITLEKLSFTIPSSYATSLPDLTIVPMWAGKEIGWRIVGNR